jgi:hypothetical protein
MADIWMDVDAALSEVPVNLMPLVDDTDFKTIETGVVYNSAGMDLRWNFVTTAGAYTSTAVTPTTGGAYDWAHKGDGMYCIEIPASGGSVNNDTEGFGWFSGVATGILPWRGPVIGFRAATINNALIDSATGLDVIADAILARDIGSGSGAGSLNERTVRSALRTVRNKTGVSAGTLTVYKEDDSTTAYTAAVTTNAAADPIVSIDPA